MNDVKLRGIVVSQNCEVKLEGKEKGRRGMNVNVAHKMVRRKGMIALSFSVFLSFLSFLLLIVGIIENSFNHYGDILSFTTKITSGSNVLSESQFPYLYVYLPHYPFVFLSIIALVLSVSLFVCNILFLGKKIKMYPYIGMVIVTLLLIESFVHTYFWIALNGNQHIINQFRYSNSYTSFYDQSTRASYDINCYSNYYDHLQNFDTICFFGTFFTIISFILTLIYFLFHYYVASNLEGPTLSETANDWFKSIVGGSKQGYTLVRNKILGPTVVKIRKVNSKFYKEVELEEKTLPALLNKISDVFEVSIDNIKDVIKEGNTIVLSDDDVSRFVTSQLVEFTLEDDNTDSIEVEQAHHSANFVIQLSEE